MTAIEKTAQRCKQAFRVDDLIVAGAAATPAFLDEMMHLNPFCKVLSGSTREQISATAWVKSFETKLNSRAVALRYSARSPFRCKI